MNKIILHLCADIGSDSRYYQLDDNYQVIMIGKDIGVENFIALAKVHGIIANPVCTEFSTAGGFDKRGDLQKAMILVNHCLRIIEQTRPEWWVLENPANGRLKEIIGKPRYVYQPWQYGSPWTKKTALWGVFNVPPRIFNEWSDVPKNDKLYIRPQRYKPSLAILHKSSVNLIPEFDWCKERVKHDSDLRSLCSQGFAKSFYKYNQ